MRRTRGVTGKSQKCDFDFFKNFFIANSLFPQEPCGKLRVKTKNAIFVFASKEFHENLGELSPAVFRDWRATPPFKRLSAFSAAFSPSLRPL